MLRNAILTIGAAMLLSAGFAAFAGAFQAAILLGVWGAILAGGIIYERYAYKTILNRLPEGKGWVRTPERFIDPQSGAVVTVYVKPLTGERAYVAEALEAKASPPPVLETLP